MSDDRTNDGRKLQRPQPKATPWSEPFWDAARSGQLVLQRCIACGTLQHYPRPWCTTCMADTLEFVDASGFGTLYTYTVIRRPTMPAFADAAPYVYALVDLDEGPRMTTNIVNCPIDDVRIGLRVRVTFEDGIPLFEPSQA